MTDTPQQTFAALTAELDYYMLVVTTVSGGERAGCLVGFATQCSIDPPRFLVCLSDKNHTTRIAAEADALAVHFLPQNADALAELFGSTTGDDTDKFDRCRWHPGPDGLPLLDACGRWFTGRILDRRPLGDHIGYLLEPFAAEKAGDAGTFAFHRAKRLDPGHEA
ncbi:MAG TPA: flavin reductase family protein [Solirubrobacteraceae bacterium]|jgi:flavin reductase (DIM6/NTAB) family NADH-FMN oxidoreductase RutF|nr:flavin reductase family protein [Solirubrobacteraceae bacterium]